MKVFLRLEYGLPGHDAFSRLFWGLDPDLFAAVLAGFAPGIALGEIVVDKTPTRSGAMYAQRAASELIIGNSRLALAVEDCTLSSGPGKADC